MASVPIPDDLLEEIFLRLPTPDTLAHASATCATFRRVTKGRAFRRRYRALHRPPLLGFMGAAGFHRAEQPHPSAPLAGALAPYAADFSFVPAVVSYSSYYKKDDVKGPRWRPQDVRGGRVLLDWISLHPRFIKSWSYHDGSDVSILMDSSEVPERGPRHVFTKRELCNAADFHLAVCDPLSRRFMLLPTIPEDLAGQPQDRLQAFEPVLAPSTGDDDEPFKVRDVEPRIDHARRPSAVVVGREGAIEMVSLVSQHGSFALHHTSLHDDTQEWKLEKIVQLPGQQGHDGYSISTVGAAEGFLFFRSVPAGNKLENFDCYSMDVKTYEITKVCTKEFFDRERALPYFSFPPLLSEPTV